MAQLGPLVNCTREGLDGRPRLGSVQPDEPNREGWRDRGVSSKHSNGLRRRTRPMGSSTSIHGRPRIPLPSRKSYPSHRSQSRINGRRNLAIDKNFRSKSWVSKVPFSNVNSVFHGRRVLRLQATGAAIASQHTFYGLHPLRPIYKCRPCVRTRVYGHIRLGSPLDGGIARSQHHREQGHGAEPPRVMEEKSDIGGGL